MYDLFLKFRRSARRKLRPIQSRAVTLCKMDNFETFQYGVVSLFLCLFFRNVSCVVNSLSLSVPMTRAVSWTFLYHVLWNPQCIKSIRVHFKRFLCEIRAGSACTIADSCRPVRQTLRAAEFVGKISHISNVLHFHHAVDHVLRLFAKWVVPVILPQVGFQRFSI